MSDIPKFNSLVTRKVLDGDKVQINDLLNKEIVVCGFSVSTSKYKESTSCVKVQFYYADDEKENRRVFFSGSSVIKDQLEEVEKKLDKDGLPFLFRATVKKNRQLLLASLAGSFLKGTG